MMKKRTTQLLALALAGMLSLGLLAECQKDTAQENTKGSQTADKEEEKHRPRTALSLPPAANPPHSPPQNTTLWRAST